MYTSCPHLPQYDSVVNLAVSVLYRNGNLGSRLSDIFPAVLLISQEVSGGVVGSLFQNLVKFDIFNISSRF